RFYFKFSKVQPGLTFIIHAKRSKLQQRFGIRTKVSIVKKSIFFKTYIYESSIQTRDQFFYFSQVQVSNGKPCIVFFVVQFYQLSVFQQSDFNALRSCINNEFFVHYSFYNKNESNLICCKYWLTAKPYVNAGGQ